MFLSDDTKAALLNTCFDAEAENFNRFFMFGFIKDTDFWGKGCEEIRNAILQFLAETDFLTQRFYMELIYLRDEYEELIAS